MDIYSIITKAVNPRDIAWHVEKEEKEEEEEEGEGEADFSSLEQSNATETG